MSFKNNDSNRLVLDIFSNKSLRIENAKKCNNLPSQFALKKWPRRPDFHNRRPQMLDKFSRSGTISPAVSVRAKWMATRQFFHGYCRKQFQRPPQLGATSDQTVLTRDQHLGGGTDGKSPTVHLWTVERKSLLFYSFPEAGQNRCIFRYRIS